MGQWIGGGGIQMPLGSLRYQSRFVSNAFRAADHKLSCKSPFHMSLGSMAAGSGYLLMGEAPKAKLKLCFAHHHLASRIEEVGFSLSSDVSRFFARRLFDGCDIRSVQFEAMKTGRKNLKKISAKDAVTLPEGHSIMQVISLRGSNLIEVMDSKGVNSLALFPAKFQRSFWIKRGNFVVIDESGRDKALESGSKITCMVSQVLFHDQVRTLERSSEWPAVFKAKVINDSKAHQNLQTAENVEDLDSNDEDNLPPLEANLNRSRPVELYSDVESDSDYDQSS